MEIEQEEPPSWLSRTRARLAGRGHHAGQAPRYAGLVEGSFARRIVFLCIVLLVVKLLFLVRMAAS
jgi:hypothetical protein